MKITSPIQKTFVLALAAAVAFAASKTASAGVINIDFGATDGASSSANYVGSGAVGDAGTYYNLVNTASSQFEIVSGSDLVTSTSVSTLAGFSVGNILAPVASGYSPIPANSPYAGYLNGASLGLDGASYDSHVGASTAGVNDTTSTTFTLTGLVAGTSGAIFFETSTNNYEPAGLFTLTTGGTHVSYASTGAPFTSGLGDNVTYAGGNTNGNVQEFTFTGAQNDGTITGTWSVGTFSEYSGAQLSGLSVEGTFATLEVPEPSTPQFVLLGMSALFFVLWRKRRALV